MSDIRPPMTTVRLMPKAELVKEYRASFFRQSAGVTGRGDSRRIGSKEKTRIIKVVMKEPVLQMRVRAKLERLAKKVGAKKRVETRRPPKQALSLGFLWVRARTIL